MDAVVALAGRGLISDDQQFMLAGFCKRWNCSAFEALIETDMISEMSFADQAADILRLPRLSNIRNMTISEETLELLPFPFARSRAVIVTAILDHGEARSFRVAIADPWDAQSRLMVEDMLHGEVEWGVGERSDIVDAIDRHFPLKSIIPHFWEVLSGRNNG
ncbi:MAG: hypothetical protein ACKOKG_00690 [Verrucomicrobiota bacterium]